MFCNCNIVVYLLLIIIFVLLVIQFDSLLGDGKALFNSVTNWTKNGISLWTCLIWRSCLILMFHFYRSSIIWCFLQKNMNCKATNTLSWILLSVIEVSNLESIFKHNGFSKILPEKNLEEIQFLWGFQHFFTIFWVLIIIWISICTAKRTLWLVHL